MPLPAIFFQRGYPGFSRPGYSFTEIATLVLTFNAVGSVAEDAPVPVAFAEDVPFTFKV
jgi:hypothetical protein